MRGIRFFCFVAVLAFTPIFSAFADIAEPICPVVYAGSSGEFELFWFYPDLNKLNLGDISIPPDGVSCLGNNQDARYTLLTRFPVKPPVLVSSASTFISGQDLFLDSPGDQFIPIIMSLKRAVSPDSFSDYWSQLVGLDSLSSSPAGEVVEGEIGINLTGDFEAWVGLEWLEDFPTAPMLGTKTGLQTLEQYARVITNSTFQMQECQDEYMVGLDLLSWSARGDDFSAKQGEQDSIFFEIHYAADINDFFSSSIRIDSTGPDSLYSVIEIENSGYIYILASDGISSATSDYIYLDRDSLAPISIVPPVFEEQYGEGRLNEYTFQIQNYGEQIVCIGLTHDSDLIFLENDSVCVEAGDTLNISFALHNNKQSDSGTITTEIILSPENKYPILYHLVLRPADPTAVEEVSNGLPEDFSISPPQPNPFNASVSFDIHPAGDGILHFEVFNLLGQRLYSEAIPVVGISRVRWDGTEESGRQLPTGIYFFRFSSENHVAIRKGVLIK